jgi:hypothetical protein
MLAGVMLVVSWVDALLAIRKMCSLVPVTVVHQNVLPYLLLNHLHMLYCAIGWRAEGGVSCLSYPQALQHFLHELRLEDPALVNVQLSRDSEVAEVVHWASAMGDASW